VVLVDANLLLDATVFDFEYHAPARHCLDDTLNRPIRVGLPGVTLRAFLRIGTNPRIFPNPLPMREGWRRIERWLDLPNVWAPDATD